MYRDEAEFVIVGSGAGGATLARELALRGKQVLVLERGRLEPKVGTARATLGYYDLNRVTKYPPASREGILLWRAFMAGGSTVVATGNQVPALSDELEEHGITLEDELQEAAEEMGVAPIDEALLGEASLRIRQAARDLGYRMEPMPKAIDARRCGRCAMCTAGCPQDAKWTALEYVREAVEHGAEFRYGTQVQKVLTNAGRATGVSALGQDGMTEIRSRVVVLAAGGLATPVLLQRSGIAGAGDRLFLDLFANTIGVSDGFGLTREPAMSLVDDEFHQSEGFILSPFIPLSRSGALVEFGMRGLTFSRRRSIGLMTKITDERRGRVYPDGSVSKTVTEQDRARLDRGIGISKEILIKAGADPGSILVSKPQGAHPGATAAIGRVVDSDLQTGIDGLFVCDGSVLPSAPGMPPIMTIVALAKRLAKCLA